MFELSILSICENFIAIHLSVLEIPTEGSQSTPPLRSFSQPYTSEDQKTGNFKRIHLLTSMYRKRVFKVTSFFSFPILFILQNV